MLEGYVDAAITEVNEEYEEEKRMTTMNMLSKNFSAMTSNEDS